MCTRRREVRRVARALRDHAQLVLALLFFCCGVHSLLYFCGAVRWTVVVVRFGGLPAGVRRKAAVVPGMLSLTELRFWAQIRRGPASVEPYGRLALVETDC